MRSYCLALLCLSFAITPATALACSCAHPPPPEPNATINPVARVPDKDEVVFEGTVTNAQLKGSLFDTKPGELFSADLDQDSPYMLVTFNVSRSYAGQQGKTVELKTGMGGGDCGYPFEVGKQYLVYAWKDESGKLSTGICSGTGLLEERKADLAALRGEPAVSPDADNPVPPSTRLCGHVVNSSQPSSTENSILLISKGNKSPIPTDGAELADDGSFCAKNVAPGEYYLLYVGTTEDAPTTLGFYPGVTKFSDAKTIILKNGQPIDNLLLEVPFQPSYSVSGSVSTASIPSAQIQPKVLLVRAGQLLLRLGYVVELSPDGSFLFPRVLPGKYWAIVSVDGDDNAKWFTTKVEVDVENDVSGLSLTLIQK
jgi:hypothetical protein